MSLLNHGLAWKWRRHPITAAVWLSLLREGKLQFAFSFTKYMRTVFIIQIFLHSFQGMQRYAFLTWLNSKNMYFNFLLKIHNVVVALHMVEAQESAAGSTARDSPVPISTWPAGRSITEVVCASPCPFLRATGAL